MKSNDTYLNILASYAYLNNSREFESIFYDASRSGVINTMIDSGAFTLHNAKAKRDWLNVDNYCKYLDKNADYVEKYVMLDVIGNESKSKENYELMLKRGLNPMFVFTMADMDYEYLKAAVKNNEHVCVAGGVTNKGAWVQQRFQKVYKTTQGKIHGLGYVTYPNMYKLPLHSTDSSSWLQAPLVFGNIPYFDNGLKGFGYKDVLKKKRRIPEQVKPIFEDAKITPQNFSNINYHKGNRSIGFFMSIIAFIEYQKVSRRAGLRLFMAVANVDQLKAILFINNQLINDNLNYHEFRKL